MIPDVTLPPELPRVVRVVLAAAEVGHRLLEVQAAAVVGRIIARIRFCGIYRIVAEGDGAAGVIVAAAVADGT